MTPTLTEMLLVFFFKWMVLNINFDFHIIRKFKMMARPNKLSDWLNFKYFFRTYMYDGTVT
jgi:hypothetical protein